MKRQYVRDLAEGCRVDCVLALRAKEVRSTRTGEAYLALELADRTGRIAGVMFRPDADAQHIPVSSVARVRGVVTTFRGTTRVSVESLVAVTDWDAADLLPSAHRDRTEMVAELRALIRGVSDPDLVRLLRTVFGDRGFFRRFARCPGAQEHHHAYIGGLLEHTVSVATLCRDLSRLYPAVDADLLLAGALLHDIGKVDELSCATQIEYTDEGRLVGHVVLGDRRLRDAIAKAGLPEKTALRLSHLVLSHHGELEWGAPKRPSSVEALVLHHADNLDAKTNGFLEAAAAAARVEEGWTDATNLFRRPLYAPRAAEDDRWHPATEDDQYLARGA